MLVFISLRGIKLSNSDVNQGWQDQHGAVKAVYYFKLEGLNAVADIPVPLKIVSSNLWPLGPLESLILPVCVVLNQGWLQDQHGAVKYFFKLEEANPIFPQLHTLSLIPLK
jgi:hypothetical protein